MIKLPNLEIKYIQEVKCSVRVVWSALSVLLPVQTPPN